MGKRTVNQGDSNTESEGELGAFVMGVGGKPSLRKAVHYATILGN